MNLWADVKQLTWKLAKTVLFIAALPLILCFVFAVFIISAVGEQMNKFSRSGNK